MPRDYKTVLEANKAAKRAAEEKAAEEERLQKADAFAELQKLAQEAAATGVAPAVEVRAENGLGLLFDVSRCSLCVAIAESGILMSLL